MGPIPEWQRFLDACARGNHLIAWTSTDPFRRDLTDRFLGHGLASDERVVVLLPRDELRGIQAFTWRGERLESLAASGRMRIIPSEDILAELCTATEGRPQAVRRILGSLIREAGDGGYAGVRILGRVAPLFFERAEDGVAAEIEEQVRFFRPYCSVLCLYRTASLDLPARGVAAMRITRAHTHSILELPDGAVLCTPGPSDAPAGGGG